MRRTIELRTREREELVDITREVETVVRDSGVLEGLCSVYAQGATAAIMGPRADRRVVCAVLGDGG
jgi:thiamine phosphate synthase YjbQ (UPF0047 family)